MSQKEFKKYNILVTGPPIVSEAIASLEKVSHVQMITNSPTEDQIVSLAKEYSIDAMIIRQGKITSRVLQASKNLKIVIKHGVGVDNIDVDSASKIGIPICITPNANFESVAELALAQMLSVARNLKSHDIRIQSGIWDKIADLGTELYGKTLGLIGIGRIGKRLSELVQPLKMNILAYDPLINTDQFPKNIEKADNLSYLLRSSDFISIHCPKTVSTVGLIGKNELSLMKSSSILINTARGGIVDEKALLNALKNGQIGGAAMDCFELEPLPNNSDIASFDGRLIRTPHVGGATHEALSRMGNEAVRIVRNYLIYGSVDSEVIINPSVLKK